MIKEILVFQMDYTVANFIHSFSGTKIKLVSKLSFWRWKRPQANAE